MATTTPNALPKIADFNIVDMNTTPQAIESVPGMAGIEIIQPSTQQKLQHYYSLSDVTADYGSDTYAYQAAAKYFDNPNATVFYVLNYDANGTSSTPNQSNDTGNQAEVENPDGSTQSQAQQLHQQILNGSNSNNSNSSTSTDPAVAALTKYYDSGAEYFVFEVASKADQKTAIDLAELVEGQQKGVLFLDQPTSSIATADDFKWYQPIKSYRSDVLFSLPYSGDPAGYQFVPSVLAKYAGGNPSSNLELTNNLPGITPQDFYNFTNADFDTYTKAGVITYVYRNNIPMLSSGNTASHYQVSDLITRDYLNYHITSMVTNLLVNAHNAGKDIKYDQKGVDTLVAGIRTVLDDAVDHDYIQNPHVDDIDVSRIPENVKEEGIVNGLTFYWNPQNNINKVTLRQVINVPLMNID